MGMVATRVVGCSTSRSPHQTATTSFRYRTNIGMGAYSGASSPKGIPECESSSYLPDRDRDHRRLTPLPLHRFTASPFAFSAPISLRRDTSLTDPWARMISYHFLNQTDRGNFFTNNTAHGAGQLWSDVPLIPSWQQHLVPFPIIQADSRPVGSDSTASLDPASTVYEVNAGRLRVECGPLLTSRLR